MAIPQGATDVSNAAEATAGVQRLTSHRELAVDVEADSMHAFRARLCFVQLGTDDEVMLFDTLQPGVDARLLAPAFADPTVTKFFHAAGGDLQFLAEAGVRVKSLFDTHRAATLLGWQKVGLADLALERLGVTLKKEHQQSDFSIRPLPPAMREYIADDVRYLVEIGRQVRAECEKADVLEEVELDCQRLADEAAARPDVGADFRAKLPRHQMSKEQLALAQALVRELHARRLRWAEAANVPLGRMLSNAAVTALALKPPANLKSLSRTEGVRGAFAREHGEEVLALIAELSAKAKRGELPIEAAEKKSDSATRKREDQLKAFRAAKATERKVTPSAVLSNPLVEALAKSPPRSVDDLTAIPYFGEKRVRLYGAELIALLNK